MNDEIKNAILKSLNELETGLADMSAKLAQLKRIMNADSIPPVVDAKSTIDELRRQLLERANAEREAIMKQAQEAVSGAQNQMATGRQTFPTFPMMPPGRKGNV